MTSDDDELTVWVLADGVEAAPGEVVATAHPVEEGLVVAVLLAVDLDRPWALAQRDHVLGKLGDD